VTPTRRAAAAAVVALAIGLAGCSATVSLTPAADANNPGCAKVMVLLPGSLAGQDRRWTDAQSTAAWGSPATVIMSCGVAPPGPTTLKCISLGGVDWIVDDSDYPRVKVTTFGRTPAIQVYMDTTTKGVDSNQVLSQLGGQIAQVLPQSGEPCTDPETPSS
jgi:hypothetical protein